MNTLAVEIEDASKLYRIYPNRLARLGDLLWPGRRRHVHFQAALKDISLTIPAGQCIGFIGRNGSGKSTLLRMVAGITHPSQGRVKTNGRLSCVLDLQGGFNPYLSGRENIFLKGALNGLTRKEMEDKYDEIVVFSGLEEFIDYTINSYSTGMIVRLGFSIAAHLDFDILLVDEVLSVGDLVFQRQCLAKIKHFVSTGKTILLASHNLGDISALCHRVVLLDKGCMIHDGETEKILAAYWKACERDQNRIPRHLHPFNPENIYGTDTKDIRIEQVRFLDGQGREKSEFQTGGPMSVAVRFQCRRPVTDPLFRIQFFRNDGLMVHGANTDRVSFKTGVLEDEGEIVLDYECLNLLEGDYYVSVGIWPDEYRSLLTDIAYDCRQWAHVVSIRSQRKDGGGLVCNPFTWRLTGSRFKTSNHVQGQGRR